MLTTLQKQILKLKNYPYFKFTTSKSYNTQTLPINNYLRHHLINNHIYEIKKFQYDLLIAIQNGHHCFLNSATGSGKTLAYLLPILNSLLNQADAKQKQGKNNRQLLHGAIILTLNKELCLQGYKNIRLFDPSNKLMTCRTGSISHYMPVVKQLSISTGTEQQSNKIDRMILDNLINILKWNRNDIVLSTPQLLRNIIESAENRKQNIDEIIAPEFVVIDQADLLLEIDKNLSRSTFYLIQHFHKNIQKLSKNNLSPAKNTPKYIIVSSSFPHKLKNKPYFQCLKQLFKDIQIIEGEQTHQIPEQIDLYSIETKNMPDTKIFYLLDILKQKYIDTIICRKSKKVIIFCNSKESVEEVQAAIGEAGGDFVTHAYYAALDSNQRAMVLHRFQTEQTSILISTDLGSRGLDFKLPVNLIIEYEMAENVTGFLNRVGRTGRNKIKGQVISFVEPQKEQLFKHIEELISKNSKLDEVFSRKRSYSKFYKEKTI